MGEERDVVLPDGTTVRVRSIRADDRERLLRMWDRTSERSRRLRFHGTFQLTDDNVGRFTDLDPAVQHALVATLGRDDDERVVAVTRYERDAPGSPELLAYHALLLSYDGDDRRAIALNERALAMTPHPLAWIRTNLGLT